MEPSERPRPSPPLPAPGWTDAWALFLDVDGSLLDFAQHPGEVETPEGLQRDIEALHAGLDGALALVSGRAIDAIDEVLDALHHIPAAGLHGLERREAGGAYFAPPPAPDALNALHAEAQHVAVTFPGAVAERKGPNLALHWRAAPLAQDPFRAFAAAALRLLPGYRVQSGDMVLELRPGGESADKGTAVETFLQQPPFRGRRPVFIGDDLTDEHAFAVVNARDGISILVGDREDSAARWQLANPAAVRAWLHGLAATLTTGVHA
jgi:trehalose 6-phosphate phosphatase